MWKQLIGQPLSVPTLFKERRCLGQVLLCAVLITGVAWTPIIFITSLPSVVGPLSVHVTFMGLFITSLIGMAVFIYAMVSYTFSYLLLMDLRERIWPALEQSRQVVSRHWWRISGLVILLATLNVETYCLSGAMIQIVSGGLAFNWLCMANKGYGQGALILLVSPLLDGLSPAVSSPWYMQISMDCRPQSQKHARLIRSIDSLLTPSYNAVTIRLSFHSSWPRLSRTI